MAKLRLMVDLNVIMDVIQRRKPYHIISDQVWKQIEEGHAEGYIAAHSLTTLFYLVEQKTNAKQALQVVKKILGLLNVATVDQSTIDTAVQWAWKDFEDCVVAVAAQQCGATYVVTRNVKDFKRGIIDVVTPTQMLSLLAKK